MWEIMIKTKNNSELVAVGLENDGELSEPLTTAVQPDRTVYAGINMSCYKTYCGPAGDGETYLVLSLKR